MITIYTPKRGWLEVRDLDDLIKQLQEIKQFFNPKEDDIYIDEDGDFAFTDKDGDFWVWDGREFSLGDVCSECKRFFTYRHLKNRICDDCWEKIELGFL